MAADLDYTEIWMPKPKAPHSHPLTEADLRQVREQYLKVLGLKELGGMVTCRGLPTPGDRAISRWKLGSRPTLPGMIAAAWPAPRSLPFPAALRCPDMLLGTFLQDFVFQGQDSTHSPRGKDEVGLGGQEGRKHKSPWGWEGASSAPVGLWVEPRQRHHRIRK